MSSKQIRNSRVLVTGGAGFIGSNLCEKLLGQENKVICLDNFATGKRENIQPFLTHPSFELFEGDIRHFDDCKKAAAEADIILHHAALGSVPRSIDDPITTNEVNTTGFLNMLYAAKEACVKRFVYAASSSTYGDNKDLPKKEENIGKPLSPYAVTKQVNELYAGVFSDLFGMEIIGLRYFNVFGKRQDPYGHYAAAIPKFISALLACKSPVVDGDGKQTRDFTYIKNVIHANQLAATTTDSNAFGRVFNIACGESMAINDILLLITEILSSFDKNVTKVQVKYGPERIGDVRHTLASIDRAKKWLKYQPQYDMKSGLKETIDWYWSQYK